MVQERLYSVFTANPRVCKQKTKTRNANQQLQEWCSETLALFEYAPSIYSLGSSWLNMAGNICGNMDVRIFGMTRSRFRHGAVDKRRAA